MRTVVRASTSTLMLTMVAIGTAALLHVAVGSNDPPSDVDTTQPVAPTAELRATGRLEPQETIDIGTVMCGTIVALGTDADGRPIDSGSPVRQGMILARLDDRLPAAEVAQAEAALAQAHSAVRKAQADIRQYLAKLPQAEARWTATCHLDESGAANPMELIANRSEFDVAAANVEIGRAALDQAHSAVAQAQAMLEHARRKHELCVIRSPVSGVILERRVTVGQTLVSNAKAPSLFLIAKDLQRMIVRAPVQERDIGHIYPGQPVRFTADALPGQTFAGTVEKIRLDGYAGVQGTAYTVDVATENPDGGLLPYLTTQVRFLPGSR